MYTHKDEIHLRDYYRVLSKRRNVFLLFFSLVVGIVTIYSLVSIPVYEGITSLLIDMEKNSSMTFVEGAGYVPVEKTKDNQQTHIGIFRTRSFADRVVRKLQLDKSAYFIEKKLKKENSLVSFTLNWMKDAVNSVFPKKTEDIKNLQDDIKQELDPILTDIVMEEMNMEIGKEVNMLKITYSADDPRVAAIISNGVAQAYIEHNLDIRVRPYRDAIEWLSARMVDLRSKVVTSEKKLQTYKEKTGIVSFSEKENVITQKLQELVSQLVQAETKRQEADARYNQIKAVIDKPERLETLPEIVNNVVIQGIKNEELRLKTKISELSEKYGPKHPQIIKTKTELEEVKKNFFVEARKMLNAAKTEYEVAGARESSLRKAVEEQKKTVMELGKKSIDYGVVAGESDSNKQFYELLLKKLQEATLSGGINVSDVQIVDWALPQESPVRPKRLLYILMSIVAGLFGGAGLSIFVEYLDDTVKTSEDIEFKFKLPFIGLVPSAELKNNSGKPMVYLVSSPRSIVSEVYKGIRTSVVLSSADNGLKVILIASAGPKDGKTTTAINLSAAMAQFGESVLLIDCDLRKSKIHEAFSLNNTVGLSNIIAGGNGIPPVIKTVKNLPNLNVITAGSSPPNPSVLLSSRYMSYLLSGLREKYDRIIIDSPPLLAVSDALTLSSLSDGVLLVAKGGVTKEDALMRCKKSLEGVKSNIIGVIINNVTLEGNDYYYPYYKQYTE